MTLEDLSPVLRELVSLALAHGVRSGTAAGYQDPFVIVQKDTGERELARFIAAGKESQQEMLQKGIDFVRSQPSRVTAFALAFAAQVEVQAQPTSGVAVHAGERGQERGVLFFRPYPSPDGTNEKATVFLGRPSQLLWGRADPDAAGPQDEEREPAKARLLKAIFGDPHDPKPVAPYAALEGALRSGAVLECHRESARGGYACVASVASPVRPESLLALGSGVTVRQALDAAEEDYRRGGTTAAAVRGENCPTCAVERLDLTGTAAGESVLDRHVVDGHGFAVQWCGEGFRGVSEWRRRAALPREVMRQLIASGAPSRWRHGDHVWDIIPRRDHRTGEWKAAEFQSVSRPGGSKDIVPVERRRVEVLGPSLGAVLKTAEERLADARREDEEWQGRMARLT